MEQYVDHSHGAPPPSYTSVIRENEAEEANLLRAEHVAAAANTPPENVVHQQQAVEVIRHSTEVTWNNIIEHRSKAFKQLNADNSYGGLIHILYSHRKQPRTVKLNLLYEVGLLLYFIISLVSQIVVWSVKQKYHAYYLCFIVTCMAGII